MWRFVEMYGTFNAVDCVVATALTANSNILLACSQARQSDSGTSGPLVAAIANDVKMVRGCWGLVHELDKPASKAGRKRWSGWQAGSASIPGSAQLATELAHRTAKVKTRSALERFADLAATSAPSVSGDDPSGETSATVLIDQLADRAEDDSAAWRSLNGAGTSGRAAEVDVFEALFGVVFERWRKGAKCGKRFLAAWLDGERLKSVSKLRKHSKRLADLLFVLEAVEPTLASPSPALADELAETLTSLKTMNELREHPAIMAIGGKDGVRVSSAIDVGVRELAEQCGKLIERLYGPSSDSVEIELRSALSAMNSDRQLELAALPGRAGELTEND